MTATGASETGSYSLSYANNASGAPQTNRISSYTYDAAGNVTNDGGVYTYDAASRMKTAGGTNYSFDGDGRRVRVQQGGYSSIYYLWSSVLGQPVAEIVGETGTLFQAYVYGAGGGQMLVLLSNDGTFYWSHQDHLGSGRKLTDSTGAVRYRGEFDPHGQTLLEVTSGGTGTYANSHKYTGYEREWSTNLDYAQARMYNHNRARFMQPDPLGIGAADLSAPQTLNSYSYVGNDPVNFVDPSGLNLEEPGGVTCVRYHYYNPATGVGFWGAWSCSDGEGNAGGGGGGNMITQSTMRTPSACERFVNSLVSQVQAAFARIRSTSFLFRAHKWAYERTALGTTLARNGMTYRDADGDEVNYHDINAVSGFKTVLTQYGQDQDVYRHVQFVAGLTLIGNSAAATARAAFISYDRAQSLLINESKSEYQGDLAGLAVGNALVDALSSGDFSGLAKRLNGTLCNS